MVEAVATYTLPVYQAVVCGLTLTTKIQEDESQHKLALAIGLEEKLRIAIERFDAGDFSKISRPDIQVIATALATLVNTVRTAESVLCSSGVSGPYRPAMEDTLANIEHGARRFEEIAEAWCMASNETSISEIREAIRQTSRNTDASPWREVLASIKD
jgi:hypothetical protein